MRNFIVLIVLFVFLNVRSLGSGKERPNLVFIFPDQMRYYSTGYVGEDPVQTPNLDRLAGEGITVSDAISNQPLSSPYRAMMMTGRLNYNNGVLSNCNSERYQYGNDWRKDQVSITDILKKEGYSAGYVGKLHLKCPAPIPDKDTVLWDAFQPVEERHGVDFWYSYGTFDEHFNGHYWRGQTEKEIVHTNQWTPVHEADVVIDYLKNTAGTYRKEGEPFVLFWSINPPHPPYPEVPQQYRDLYRDKTAGELLTRPNVMTEGFPQQIAFHRGASTGLNELAGKHAGDYFAMVSGVDEQIGRVLAALREQGLDENTIVVFTSDHGEMLGSHGLMSKNIWYEEAVRVPFILRYPGVVPSGVRREMLLNAYDVMPTLISLMGFADQLPGDIDGKDYSGRIITGKGDTAKAAPYYFMQGGDPQKGYRGIRTLTHTYVIAIEDGKVHSFLYDNVKDPYQLQNIVEKDLAMQKKMHRLFLSELEAKKDPWLAYYGRVIQNMRSGESALK